MTTTIVAVDTAKARELSDAMLAAMKGYRTVEMISACESVVAYILHRICPSHEVAVEGVDNMAADIKDTLRAIYHGSEAAKLSG